MNILYDSLLQFTNAILKSLSENTCGSFVVSPYSYLNVATLLLNGAESETRTQLEKYFNYEGSLEDLNIDMIKLGEILNNDKKDCVDSNNLLISDSNLDLDFRFYKKMFKNFNLIFLPVDFSDFELSLDEIDKIVGTESFNEVNNIIKKKLKKTSPLIINTLKFNQKWLKPFLKETVAEDFTNGEETSKIQMMKQTEVLKYYEDEFLQAVELQYEDKDYTFIAIIDKEKTHSKQISKILFEDNFFEKIFTSMEDKLVHLTLPKFYLESNFNIKDDFHDEEFNKILQNAKFSEMFGSTAVECPEIYQSSVLIVDTDGTTALNTTEEVGLLSKLSEITLTFNRPFLFYIVKKISEEETSEKTILPIYLGNFEN